MAAENVPISLLPKSDPLTGLEPIPTVQGDETLSPSSVTDNYIEKTTVATTPTDIATFVGNAVPPAGTITMYAGSTAPSGWLLCDGQLLQNSAKYSKLYGVIGTTFTGNETGAGANKFRVPDLRGKVIVGYSETANGNKLNGLGKTGGEYQHTLQLAAIPPHKHAFQNGSITINDSNTQPKFDGVAGEYGYKNDKFGTGYGFTDRQTTGMNTKQLATAAIPHENMPPYVVLNYIIKY